MTNNYSGGEIAKHIIKTKDVDEKVHYSGNSENIIDAWMNGRQGATGKQEASVFTLKTDRQSLRKISVKS